MNVRIGIADAGREIEFDVDQPGDIEAEINQAFNDGQAVFWVTDTTGNRFGIPVARIAYVEISGEPRPQVGFG